MLLCVLLLTAVVATGREAPLIIDHTCTDLTRIPDYWLDQARALFRVGYGHTSHGSQLVSGMENFRGAEGSRYDYTSANWAVDWAAANPTHWLNVADSSCVDCGCAHSVYLNCNLKGAAFWWMMARLAGWPGAPRGERVHRAANQVEVEWSSLCTGTVYEVHGTQTLAPTSNWSWVSAFTNRNGHTNSCVLPANSERCYYRLEQQ